MVAGQQFSFVVSPDIAGRMDRVVMVNDGMVVNKRRDGANVVFKVERT